MTNGDNNNNFYIGLSLSEGALVTAVNSVNVNVYVYMLLPERCIITLLLIAVNVNMTLTQNTDLIYNICIWWGEKNLIQANAKSPEQSWAHLHES